MDQRDSEGDGREARGDATRVDPSEPESPTQCAMAASCATFTMYYGGQGCITPFLPIFFASMVDARSVGLLIALPPIINIFAKPLIAVASDLLHAHRAVAMLSLLGQGALQLALLTSRDFNVLLSISAVNAVVGGNAGVQLDAVTVHELGPRYGTVRLWGALGFGISVLVGGLLLRTSDGVDKDVLGNLTEASWTSDDQQFQPLDFVPLFLLSSSLLALTVPWLYRMNFGVLSEKPAAADGTAPLTAREKMRLFGVSLLRPNALCFVGLIYLSGIASGLIDTFLYIYLTEQGADGALIGTARLITCLAEVPFFHFSQALLKRCGLMGVIALAQVAYVVRLLWYVFLPIPVLVLPSEILHGLTFAALWSAGCNFAQRIAPNAMKASMQGVVSTVHWGCGVGTGAYVGGIAYSEFGAQRTFLGGAVVSGVALLISLCGCWYWGCDGGVPTIEESPPSYELVGGEDEDEDMRLLE